MKANEREIKCYIIYIYIYIERERERDRQTDRQTLRKANGTETGY